MWISLYLTIAEEILKTPFEKGLPTAEEKMSETFN
jgi:hypothetical protein